MANSTVFIPREKYPYVGKNECIDPIQENMKILEISTRSKNPFGKSLSPWNLQITMSSGKKIKVECAYQGSKVVKITEGKTRQFESLYWGSPRDAFFDTRIKDVPPVAFRFFGKEYPLTPKHCFFDFLYIVSLIQRKDDVFQKLSEYDGYTDTFYSLKKDSNSPARAASKYVSLRRQGLIEDKTPSSKILELLLGSE